MKVVNEVLMADIKKRDEKVTDMTAAVQQSEASRELALEEIKVFFFLVLIFVYGIYTDICSSNLFDQGFSPHVFN